MVQEPPLLRGGFSVLLAVALVGDVTQESIDILNGFIDAFWALGTSGALAGNSVAPWKATLGNKSDPEIAAGLVQWIVDGCDLDERALINLVHLLLAAHETIPIREIIIAEPLRSRATRQLVEDPKIEDPYPPRWPNQTFQIEVEPAVTDSAIVRMMYTRELTPEEISDIRATLLDWAVAASVGAYAIAPISPMGTFVDPELELEVWDRELTWNLHKVRLPPAAFDGLVNVCFGIDRTIAPLSGLWID